MIQELRKLIENKEKKQIFNNIWVELGKPNLSEKWSPSKYSKIDLGRSNKDGKNIKEMIEEYVDYLVLMEKVPKWRR